MLYLLTAGIVALVFGILLLLAPETLKKIEEVTNKTLLVFDKKVYNLRIGLGISMILASALFFFIVYYLVKKYGA